MKNYSKRTLLVNVFGSFGYLTCFFLWGWVGILYLPMLLENNHVEQFLLPAPTQDVVPTPVSPEVSPVAIVFALGVAIVVVIATVIVLLRAPITIARTGKTVTTKAAASALPLITRGQPLPAIKKRRLTAGLIKLAKLLLALLPVAIGFLGAVVEPPLPFELVLLISSALALIAIGWFSVQYIFARMLGVSQEQLV